MYAWIVSVLWAPLVALIATLLGIPIALPV